MFLALSSTSKKPKKGYKTSIHYFKNICQIYMLFILSNFANSVDNWFDIFSVRSTTSQIRKYLAFFYPYFYSFMLVMQSSYYKPMIKV